MRYQRHSFAALFSDNSLWSGIPTVFLLLGDTLLDLFETLVVV